MPAKNWRLSETPALRYDITRLKRRSRARAATWWRDRARARPASHFPAATPWLRQRRSIRALREDEREKCDERDAADRPGEKRSTMNERDPLRRSRSRRWQNRAPATSDPPHEAHCAPATQPQLEQNRPRADAPQAGQVVVSVVVTVRI